MHFHQFLLLLCVHRYSMFYEHGCSSCPFLLLQGTTVVVSTTRTYSDFTPEATFDIKVRLLWYFTLVAHFHILAPASPQDIICASPPVEMWRPQIGGGPTHAGGSDPWGGSTVLQNHADHEAHGAEGRPALQAEDHPGILSLIRRPGGVQFLIPLKEDLLRHRSVSLVGV